MKHNRTNDLDDVNDITWPPTGDAIASASDDSTIRLFDLRADAELGCYQRKPVMFSCNALDFSVRLIQGINVRELSTLSIKALFIKCTSDHEKVTPIFFNENNQKSPSIVLG